ncbi:hypothetical protein MNBD_NITROSPINAE02-1655 [hydrothermal vent metagenome]|uniref:Methyltransferase domain-containing protein n=1 Tax=hydrothermal vent metagenome TaxID=652676 RepID=A0A3B1C647_9ZZZZ
MRNIVIWLIRFLTRIVKFKSVKQMWTDRYADPDPGKLAWYTNEIDNEVKLAIEKYCPRGGKALDIGTGPGTMAKELAKAGYQVTAVDIAEPAIEMAKRLTQDYSDSIEFRVDNIIETGLTGKYNVAHDRGCFHVFAGNKRGLYVENVYNLLEENGILLLKTFSKKQAGLYGPTRYNIEELTRLFDGRFELLHWEESTYPGTADFEPKAIFCVFKKKSND